MENNWQIIDGKLQKNLEFPDFVSAIAFINKVADLAEAQNHHPDISIHYNKVSLELWTHTEGKVSEKDYKLAIDIDKIS